jgi:uncharacterized protein YndB with AHSA1/START domain
MATTRRVMGGISPEAVFDALRDGWTYDRWVVGTRMIRAVEDNWPEPGSRLHFTLGYGPLRKDDETRSLRYEPGTRLELEAHAWPAGTARIDLRAEAIHEGTLVSITEHPQRGPAGLAHNPLFDALIHLRNVETLRRLEGVVRSHDRAGTG